MQRSAAAPVIALGALALVWGYNWVAIKVATTYSGPFEFSAMRTVLAVVVLFAALLVLRKPLAPTPLLSSVALGLLQTTAFMLLQVLAVAGGGAGKSAILVYTMPFWLIAFAWPLLGERIGGLQLVAIALSAVGIGFVLAPFDWHAGLVPKLLAVAAAVVWAASAVFLKWFRSRHAVDLLTLTAWQMLWGTLPIVLIALAVPESAPEPTPAFFAALAFVAVLGTALAWLLWMFALSRLPAGLTGLASLATPVVGVLAAWIQLQEVPSATERIGTGLIVAALTVTGIGGLGARRSPLQAGRANSV